jgi:hypothetical protein
LGATCDGDGVLADVLEPDELEVAVSTETVDTFANRAADDGVAESLYHVCQCRSLSRCQTNTYTSALNDKGGIALATLLLVTAGARIAVEFLPTTVVDLTSANIDRLAELNVARSDGETALPAQTGEGSRGGGKGQGNQTGVGNHRE